MTTYIKTMKDKDNNIIAPRTVASAVYLSDGVTNVETALSNAGLNDLYAENINIVDIGDYFTATQVEETLQEIGDTLANLSADASDITFTASGNIIATNVQAAIQELDSEKASTGYVDTAIANLIDSSPAALNTLNELAAALGDDANFSTTITNSIATKAPINSPTFTGTVSGISKSMVGLSNVDNTSDVNKPVSTAQQTALNAKLSLSGGTMTGNLYINNSSPTIYLKDTDNRSSMIHCNSNLFYVLRGSGNDSDSWVQYNGLWPLTINLENNDLTGGGNITAYSDIRLKKDIEIIQNPIEKITQLNGITYLDKDSIDNKRKMGLIAQEVQKVIPEVVIENGEDKILSIAYGNMIGLLIEAIKEQQKQIDELKTLLGK